MESPSRTDARNAGTADARQDPNALAWRVKRRLNELGIRTWLRHRPRVQGRVLAPAGAFKRLPTAAALYFPFYHDVLPQYARDLRRHLRAYQERGSLVTWDQALDVLAGRRVIAGPTFSLSFDDGHPTWRDVVAPMLSDLGVRATFFVTSDLIGRPGNLTWADIRELADAGHTIGSHTVTHPRLSDSDDDRARREVRESKATIEAETGLQVRDFAAPYGAPFVDFSDRDVELVRSAGYRSFATTSRRPMRAGDSPMWIQRQGLHPAWPLWAVRTRLHD